MFSSSSKKTSQQRNDNSLENNTNSINKLNKLEQLIYDKLKDVPETRDYPDHTTTDESIKNNIIKEIEKLDDKEFLFYRIIKYIHLSKKIKLKFINNNSKFVAQGHILYELVINKKDKKDQEIINLLNK